MQGDPKVLQHLNAILRNELTAIYQYFLHARMLKNWGVAKLLIGKDVPGILDCDLKLEHKGLVDLRAAIVQCETVHDFASRDLLSKILDAEEAAVDFIEAQLTLIKKMGI